MAGCTKGAVFVCALSLAAALGAGTNDVFRTARAVTDGQLRGIGRDVDLTAVITWVEERHDWSGLIGVEDATGGAILQNAPVDGADACRPGDTVRIRGYVRRCYKNESASVVTKLEILSHGPAPAPHEATVADIRGGRCDGKYVRLTGFVRDTFADELNRECLFFVIGSKTEAVFAVFVNLTGGKVDLRHLVGAKVEVSGLAGEYSNGDRPRLGRIVRLVGPQAIRVIDPPPADPFDALGRTRVKGRVLARWNGRSVLLRTESGDLSRVDLAGDRFPSVGATVEASGFAETDFYSLNLSRGDWRDAAAKVPDEEPPHALSARSILHGSDPRRPVNANCHGRTLRMTGEIRGAPTGKNVRALVSDGFVLDLDATGAPDALAGVTDGCRVSVTGVCILETDNWRPDGPFPHIRGLTLAVGDPHGVTVLARPPWWTPQRLLVLVAVLAACLAGVSLWTFLLKRLAERRGAELAAERAARFEASFRTGERTRLAIELHDSISQNLSGASLQIDAARQSFGTDGAKASRCMDVASSTLLACRHELRNCIWDLRNLAWEEKDLNDAIRKTVASLTADVDLKIRFNVPRSRLSDNAAHALLNVVRELVSNAVRHGRARTVRIAGNLDGERILCSVRDDGTGFDPSAAPGIAQGHFGLSGIRERLRRLGGTLTVESRPGEGTKVTICL